MAKKHLIKVYIALWMLLLVGLGCYFLFFETCALAEQVQMSQLQFLHLL